MTLLITFFVLSITFSFLCSIWEAVLLSVTPSYIKRAEKEAPKIGQLLAYFKKDIDRPLSAILTLNTIAHTIGAIGVGVQAGKLFGSTELTILGVHITYESVIAAAMTLAILFLSEIIPKTLGANNWKLLAPFTARSVRILILVLKPFVWLSNKIVRFLAKDKNKSVFSKQDFAAMAEVANESGHIKEDDFELIKNLLKYDDLKAEKAMTPRTVVLMADETQTLSEFYEQNPEIVFSRIPLYGETTDNITGVFLKDELLEGLLKNKGDQKLAEIKRDLVTINEKTSLRGVFKILHKKRKHVAGLVDEYGGFSGLITMEDVFETLMGLEIMDETDAIEDMQQYAKEQAEN